MKNKRRVMGLHAAESVLKNTPEQVLNVWLDDKREDRRLNELRQQLTTWGIVAQPASKKKLDSLADGEHHQGIVLELNQPAERDEADLRDALTRVTPHSLYLALDQVQDPHNLGACLRTADAVGVEGVIITRDQSTGITPTVARVACGAAETIPVYRVTNLVRSLALCKDKGLWVVGAAGESARSLYEVDLNLPLVLVTGAEGKGLRRLTREHCDLLVSIPMVGQVESLNLSVATGVLLYETLRQRTCALSGRSRQS